MRGFPFAVLLCLILVLAGCGGRGAVSDGGELPVSCVSGAGSSSCSPGRGRYYYDYQSDSCRPTSGRRCGGRRLFDSIDECRSFCGAAR